MKDGPVPSLAYDVLKEALGALSEAQIDRPLWKSNPIGGGKIQYFGAERRPDTDILSESDIEGLIEAFAFVRSTSITKLWDHVHNDRAYKDAWQKRQEGEGQHPMDLAMLFDVRNDDIAETLKFFAANQ